MIILTTGSTVYCRDTEDEAQKLIDMFERCGMRYIREVI